MKNIQLKIEQVAPSSANQTTSAIIIFLNASGCVAWRNNNVGIWDNKKKIYRKVPFSKKGIPDIVGFRKKDGKAIFIEVKAGKDRLSYEQKEFLEEAYESGCIAFCTKNFEDFEQKWQKLK